MKTYKHSGTIGDIIYSMALCKHFGPGKFYLHLGQVDWIAQHYYNRPPSEYHSGKMDQEDFDFMKEFMLAQDYILDFEPLDIINHEVTHNLDKFRPLFVGHPANYTDTYCMAMGVNNPDSRKKISDGPWLSVPSPKSIEGKPFVVNRTQRGWTAPGCNPVYKTWLDEGIDKQSIFIGLEEEWEAFKELTSWDIEFHPVANLLEMASIIAGADQFIGNQSAALAVAQGLRVPYAFEARSDLPLERNESYFPNHDNGDVF